MKHFTAFFLIGILFATADLLAQDTRYDAWYKTLVKEYTLNPDGSTDFRYKKEQKLLSYRAFHRLYGETFIVYDPRFQKLKIHEAYTVMADGKKVAVPTNAFNEVLPSAAANAPAYNALREMVITHTGLERNATIHLDYEVHTEGKELPGLMGSEVLAENEPAGNIVVRVRIPAGGILNYARLNGAPAPSTSKEGAYDVYTWSLSDVPAISAEELQPGGSGGYPRILFSTLKKAEDAYAFLVRQLAFREGVTDDMRRMIGDLLKEKPDKFTLALNIQERVVEDPRFYPVSLAQALFLCRTPVEVWNSNGGTSVEKAVLMTALMREAGIDAEVVGIVRTAPADAMIGTLTEIEDFAVAADFKNEGTWYFSVTNLNPVNLKLTLPGRTFISLIPDRKPETDQVKEPSQLVKVTGNFIISSDPKLTGELSVYLNGAAYPFAAAKRDPKRIRRSIAGFTNPGDIQDAKTTAFNPENGSQSFIVQSDKPMRADSGFYYFTLPYVTTGIDGWPLRTLASKRETSLELPSVAEENYTYTATLPANLTLFMPGRKISLKNKAGEYTWEVTNEKGKLSFVRQIRFSKRIITPELYGDFKALMDQWNNPRYKELIFRTGN